MPMTLKQHTSTVCKNADVSEELYQPARDGIHLCAKCDYIAFSSPIMASCAHRDASHPSDGHIQSDITELGLALCGLDLF